MWLCMHCSQDCSVAVLNMKAPNDIELQHSLCGHTAPVNVVDFDDKYIVSASGDKTIKVYVYPLDNSWGAIKI